MFPGGQFDKNLLPFEAAIKAGTASIMPYYSLPKGTRYEEVAYAFNKGILRDLLRGELGFEGIINSDTGPIESMPWGVEELSIEERYVKALEAGTNMFAGNADPARLIGTVKAHPETMPFVDESVRLVLEELFRLGLFENPYVDEKKASDIVGKKEFVETGKVAQRKSIVLLRNERKALPLRAGTKVYFVEHAGNSERTETGPGSIQTTSHEGLRFVSTPEEADVILLWLKPTIRPLFPADPSPLRLDLSSCAIDVNYVKELVARKPTVLVINFSNPFVIDEIYEGRSDGNFIGVLATFGVEPDALLDIVSGRVHPSGRMPFTTPISQKAVEHNKEDLPGHLEGDGYALFRFGEGLSYD